MKTKYIVPVLRVAELDAEQMMAGSLDVDNNKNGSWGEAKEQTTNYDSQNRNIWDNEW